MVNRVAEPKKVAILGATSHVAKNLIHENESRRHWELQLYARDPEAALRSLAPLRLAEVPFVGDLKDWKSRASSIDAVVNCVGFGTPEKVKAAAGSLFSVTEQIDEDILAYLAQKPSTKYINFSSGAVYGTALDHPVESGFVSQLELSPMKETDFYRISKIHQEAKHRAHKQLSILDIRLFSFFSRFMDREGGYLMNDVVECLSSGKQLLTGPNGIYRDFISPADLYNLVDLAVDAGPLNLAVDTYSAKPISKFELLERLKSEFCLEFEVAKDSFSSPTGTKPYYYSMNRQAEQAIGFHPTATSWDAVRQELSSMGYPLEHER